MATTLGGAKAGASAVVRRRTAASLGCTTVAASRNIVRFHETNEWTVAAATLSAMRASVAGRSTTRQAAMMAADNAATAASAADSRRKTAVAAGRSTPFEQVTRAMAVGVTISRSRTVAGPQAKALTWTTVAATADAAAIAITRGRLARSLLGASHRTRVAATVVDPAAIATTSGRLARSLLRASRQTRAAATITHSRITAESINHRVADEIITAATPTRNRAAAAAEAREGAAVRRRRRAAVRAGTRSGR